MKNAYEVRGDVTAIELRRRDGSTLLERLAERDIERDIAYGDTKYSREEIMAAAQEFDTAESDLLDIAGRAQAVLDRLHFGEGGQKPGMMSVRRFYFDGAALALFDCLHRDLYVVAKTHRFGPENYPVAQWVSGTRKMRASVKAITKAMIAVAA